MRKQNYKVPKYNDALGCVFYSSNNDVVLYIQADIIVENVSSIESI